jgi:lysozyme family protein
LLRKNEYQYVALSEESALLSSPIRHFCLRFSYRPHQQAKMKLKLPPNQAELTNQLAVAALGAAVITTLAVAQGQSPLTALGITVFSAVAAVAVGQVL